MGESPLPTPTLCPPVSAKRSLSDLDENHEQNIFTNNSENLKKHLPSFVSTISAGDYEQLMNISRMIDDCIMLDASMVDYFQEFKGKNSRDYRILDDHASMFVKKKFMPIPEIIVRQFESIESKCFMGIFPQISSVWITIDHRLFIWDFESETSAPLFMDHSFSSLVVSVALVRPKPGVFVSAIEHLLIVATTSKISILGLMKRKKKQTSRTNLLDEDPYAGAPASSPLSKYSLIDTKLDLSCDAVAMLSIVGAPDGRVWMGGNDGNIYELNYEGDNGSWFAWSSGRKCRKINQTSSILSALVPTFLRFGHTDPIVNLKIDATRHLLYAIAQSGCISVFSYQQSLADVSSIECVAKTENLYEDFLKICPQSLIYKRSDFKIVDLHPVTVNQSQNTCFVVSTSIGVRMSYALSIQPPSITPASHLKMAAIPIHARLPPQETDDLSITPRPTATHCSFYNRGVFIAAQVMAQSEDRIFTCVFEPSGGDATTEIAASKSSTNHPPELKGNPITILGKTWAIVEAPHSLTFDILDGSPDAEEDWWLNGLSILHECLDIHSVSPRQFLLLSNTGVTVIVKLRPLERLLQKLNAASSNPSILQTIPDDDRTIFLLILLALAPSQLCSNYPSSISQQALRIATLKKPQAGSVDGAWYSRLSPHIKAIVFLSARILRRIWRLPISSVLQNENHIPLSQGKRHRTYIDRLLRVTQDDLVQLGKFLANNWVFLGGAGAVGHIGTDESIWSSATNTFDAVTLGSLNDMISYASQGLALFSICMDHSERNLFNRLSISMQNSIRSLTFETLLATKNGHECLSELVAAILQKQLEKEALLDPIVDVISKRCPLFLSSVDIIFFQASESLRHAAKIESIVERSDLVATSLQLLNNHLHELSESRLAEICDQTRALFYHQNAAEICIFLLSSSSTKINEETIFGVIFALLDDALLVSTALQTIDHSTFSLDDQYLSKLFDSLLNFALQKSSSKKIHERIYNWLVDKSLPAYLIQKFDEVKSGSVSAPDWMRDVLWKYYVHRSMFFEAGFTLSLLSQSECIHRLSERIQYMSLSIANFKSSTSTATQQPLSNLISEQEERLEIASIQEEILVYLKENIAQISVLHSIAEAEVQSLISSLDNHLYTLSDLFNKVTQPFKLYEFSLIIIDSAQYKQQAPLVITLWTNLLQQEMVSGSPLESALRVTTRITELGQRFLPSEVAFPLEYLVDWVSKALYNGTLAVSGPSFLNTLFSSAGIDPKRLFTSFIQLLIDGKSHQLPWKLPAAKLFLCNEIIEYLSIHKEIVSHDLVSKIQQIAKDAETVSSQSPAGISMRLQELAGK